MRQIVADDRRQVFQKITVHADSMRTYDIYVDVDLANDGLDLVVEQLRGRESLLVTTPTVANLYGHDLVARLRADDVDIDSYILPVVEQSKSMNNVLAICREAQRRRFGRRAVLVGLGGGVCTDLVNFASSLYRRGISCLRFPTTLLGQVDASIGIKAGVNFCGKKSLLGCFHPPDAVLIDLSFLRTLPIDQIRNGLAEIIKMALIRDARLFELVEKFGSNLIRSRFQKPREHALEIIQRSALEMADELEPNIYEDQSYERLVDFGHSFSPAIEAESGFNVSHGQSVSIDMAFSCSIGNELGLLSNTDFDRVIACLQECGLPIASPFLTTTVAKAALSEASRHRGGNLNLVVPTDIGSSTFIKDVNQLPDSAVRAALKQLNSNQTTMTAKHRKNLRYGMVFDIGGTNLRGAIYDRIDRKLVKRASKPTPNYCRHPELSQNDILELLLRAMNELSAELTDGIIPNSISVAFAGPINEHNNITNAPTIFGDCRHHPIDLVKRLRMLWPNQDEIYLLNDVSAAGYRYVRQNDESFCVVTVGSGIGNKVFINGSPFTGIHGRGGEIGHIVIDDSDDAVICDCGEPGHLGAIASGRGTLALARTWASRDPARFADSKLASVRSQPNDIESSDIVQMFHQNDPWTRELIRFVAGTLGNALAQIHQGIGIERFVIFGGFALALGDPYRTSVANAARRACWNSGQAWDEMIELGMNDDDSGLLGAGRFAAEFSRQDSLPQWNH